MDKVFNQNTKIFTLLKGLIFSYIITAVILLLLSFLMLKVDLSATIISGGVNLAYIVSAFVGGFFVGRKIEQRKFIWGLLIGVLYFIVVLLVSLMMSGGAPLSIGSIITVLIICSLSGMLGGMIS